MRMLRDTHITTRHTYHYATHISLRRCYSPALIMQTLHLPSFEKLSYNWFTKFGRGNSEHTTNTVTLQMSLACNKIERQC